jgi:hypothetical protein
MVSEAERDRRLSKKDRALVLQRIMNSPVGRQWIWHLLADCGIFSSSLAEHHVMSYLEGKRAVGLKLFNEIQQDARCRKLFSTAQDEQLTQPKGK